MKTYAEQKGYFTEEDFRAYCIACELVLQLPNADEHGQPLRCHEVARVVAVFLADTDIKAKVIDGRLDDVIEHTWLLLPGGNVLDPYAPGRYPQVQLIDSTIARRTYRENMSTEPRPNLVARLIADLRKPSALQIYVDAREQGKTPKEALAAIPSSVLPWRHPISWMDNDGPKQEITFRFGNEFYFVKPTKEVGIDSGRTRYHVRCLACDVILHEATTGTSTRIVTHAKETHNFRGDVFYTEETK